ncbi:MAG TPA: iron-containing alcohol dehydrogenase [Rhizobium sp.]
MSAYLTNKWNYPNTVLTGPGSIARLSGIAQEIGMKRPLVVTDRGLAQARMTTEILSQLRETGIEAGLYSDVQGNPTDGNLADGVKAFNEGGHDGVIAVGGGSALDVGKCVAFMTGQSRPVWDFEDICDWWTRADADAIAPIIAVPTTAGTGSEVGRAVVITNSATHEKKIIFHPLMLPKVAIEDPELAVGLPEQLTAGTGMDALSHCFEAYCVNAFHPMADGIALEGMRIVKDYLPRAVRDGADLEARAYMFAAASMGATAFQKGLGAIHSIAHPIGARYNTHHGMTNGVLFPYVMLWNRPAIEAKMDLVARLLDLPVGGFDGVLRWVLSFRAELGIPHTLAELGIAEEHAASIAADAVNDPTALVNPIRFTVAEFEALTLAAIRGDLSART